MIRVHGFGPIYWGVEQDSQHPDKRPVAASFLMETIPPWRTSTHAVRFRIGKKELHIGTCKKGEDPEKVFRTEHSDPEVAEALRGIYDPWALDGE